jgi:multiple sugar transport system substrate-binding protein
MVRTRELAHGGHGRPARHVRGWPLAWLIVLVLVTTLFSGATNSVPRASAAGTSITVLTVGDPFEYQLVKLLPQFEKATGINVKLESVSYDQMHGQLVNAAITHSSTFDVVTPDAMWVSDFVNNGWIDQLDSYIRADKAEVQPADLIPAVVWSMDEWKGHMYTLPIAAYGMDVLYRTDVFSALHLQAPPSTTAGAGWWTWDQYLKDVKAINGQTIGGTKYFGTVIAGAQPAPIVHMYT